MIKRIREAHAAGWRAGMVNPVFLRPGGTRGVIAHIPPMNPYDNAFAPRFRPILALVWDEGYYEGVVSRFRKYRTGRK